MDNRFGKNNLGFELQRSVDVINFNALAFIGSKSGSLNSDTVNNYTYNDGNPLKTTSYYRLKQLDKDGNFCFSSVVAINGLIINKLAIISLYPNPVNNYFNAIVSSQDNELLTITVFDITGKIILEKNSNVLSGINILTINTNDYSKGIYRLNIQNKKSGEKVVSLFVK